MGPVSRVSYSSMDVWTLGHNFIGCYEREARWDPRIGQPACCGLCRTPFFLGAVNLSNSVGSVQKVAIRGLRAKCIWQGVIRGPSARKRMAC